MTTTPTSPPQPTSSAADSTEHAAQRASFVQGALFGALLTATVIGALLWFLWQPTPAPMTLLPPERAERAQQAEILPIAVPATLMVHVSGAVVAPGVYELPAAARALAAIDAAGGYTVDANVNAVNLASPLQDGMRLHVPTLDEEVSAPVTGLNDVPAQAAVDGEPININLATLLELQSLPGIGAVKAQAIIDGRPYATVDELDRATGIGPATVEELRALVTTH